MKIKIRSSFSLKIIIVVLAGILVPLAVTMLLCLFNYYKMVSRSVDSISVQQVDFLTNYMSNTFVSARENISIWMINNDIADFMESSDVSKEDEERIEKSLRNFYSIDNHYINAYLYVPSQEKLYRAFSETADIRYETIKDSEALQFIKRSWQLNAFIYPYSDSRSTLALVVPIRDRVNTRFLGYVMLKISTLYLRNIFALSNQPFGTLYCADSEGNIAYTSNVSEKLPFDFDPGLADSTVQRKKSYNIYCRHINNSDLYILNVTPLQFWRFDFTTPFLVGLLISFVVIIISLIVTVLIAHRLLAPINSLAENMTKNDPNNLKPVVLESSDDEIGVLYRTYNNMIVRINNMIESQYRSDLILKDTQLRALQLQINPHFVNNTLQMISEIAMEHDVPEIYDLLKAFSRMFFYTLRFKSSIVDLNDELTYIKHYILIQEHRFPDKFILNFDIDELAKPLSIPKMTLQPILENTFHHAFVGISRRVIVTIFTVLHDTSYEIIIEDDGCGIDRNTLNQLQENMEDINPKAETETSQMSIGLKNVNSRIRLLFGNDYGIRITSELNAGTSVSVLLPRVLPS